MADEGAVLGTTFIEILPDVSKLKPALSDAEKAAQKSGQKIEDSIAGAGKGVDRLSQRFAAARVQQENLERAVSTGSTRATSSVARFAATVEHLRSELEATRATGQTLSSEQVREYATMQAALSRYTNEVREQRRVQLLAKNATMEGGIAFRNAEQALSFASGGLANFAIRGGIVIALLNEAKNLLFSSTPRDVLENSWLGALEKFTVGGFLQGATRNLFDSIVNGPAALGALLTGGTAGLATYGATSGQSGELLGNLSKRWQGFAGPGKPGATPDAGALEKMQAFLRVQRERILQLDLESAKLRDNADAIRTVQNAMDELLAKDLRAQGYDQENIDSIITKTKANRELAKSMQLQKQVQDAIEAATAKARASIRSSIDNAFGTTTFQFGPSAAYDKFAAEASKRELLAIRQMRGDTLTIARQAALDAEKAWEDAVTKDVTHDRERDALIAAGRRALAAELNGIDEQYGTDFRAIVSRQVRDYGTSAQQIESLTKDTVSILENGWETGFFDAITGNFSKLRSDFRSMLDSLAQDLIRFFVRKEVQQLLELFLSHIGGVSFASSTFTTTPGVSFSANGGVLQGGWRPFANGGVVTQPTLGLVGEGRYNEAVVPLPDGSRIPVQLHRSGAAEDKIAVHLSWEPGLIANIIAGGGEAGMARVAEDIRNGGPLHRQIVQVARRA